MVSLAQFFMCYAKQRALTQKKIALLARFPSFLTEHEKMQSQLKCNFADFGFLQQELPYFHVLRQSSVTTVL